MTDSMQRFVSTPNRMPDKRQVAERRADFREIFGDYEPSAAAEQAARCSQCGIPYCQIHCPLQNNIPDWLMLAAQGRLEEAYAQSSATNNMPEICGRICPHDRLCEGNCVIETSGHGTVTIGAVERFITETAWTEGWVKPPTPSRELDRSVGVIGAGPACLAAGEQLRRQGYQVDVYDRYDRVGGLLVYGIPNFKLEKEVVERRARLLADGGIVFHKGFEVGRDASLDELRARHDAVVIATGVYTSRDIAVPGVGFKNVIQALDYLIASNRKGLGDAVSDFDSGALNAHGKDVVVVGGGDTAMDCVRTAVRQGAKSVKCLYRRNRDIMPGALREVEHAEEEGVEFIWLAAPEAFLGNGRVNGFRAQRMRLGAPDVGGRRVPETDGGDPFTTPADLVIKALGFDAEDLRELFNCPNLTVGPKGQIEIDWETMATNLDGVFAAGDIVRGASLVVWAILDGRNAATHIAAYIRAAARDDKAA